jgi:hypothetical protein
LNLMNLLARTLRPPRKAFPMNLFSAAVVGSVVVLLSACSASAEPVGDPGQSFDRAATISTHADPVSLIGTWVFVLDESDVASKVRERCSATAGGDVSRSEACYAEVRTEGATEKIRFAAGANGHTQWTSFGEKGASVELFLEVPMDLSSEGPTRIAGRIAGTPIGLQADGARAHMPVGTVVHFEQVDARTIAMVDPAKGRLVYRRD